MLMIPIAAGAQALTWTPRSIVLTHDQRPPITVHNPGRQPVRFDSLEAWADERAHGAVYWYIQTPNGPINSLNEWPGLDGKAFRQGIYVKRFVDPLRNKNLTVPAGGSLVMKEWSYDPCPVCKQSALGAAPADSGHFRFIFHAGPAADTVDVVIAPEYVVGLGAVASLRPRTQQTPSGRWDASGRRLPERGSIRRRDASGLVR